MAFEMTKEQNNKEEIGNALKVMHGGYEEVTEQNSKVTFGVKEYNKTHPNKASIRFYNEGLKVGKEQMINELKRNGAFQVGQEKVIKEEIEFLEGLYDCDSLDGMPLIMVEERLSKLKDQTGTGKEII